MNGSSYGVNSYTRVGLTLRMLESYLGSETMARVMRTYYQRWRFGHPSTQDFIATVNSVSGRNMDWFFQQFFYGSNLVDYAVTEIHSEEIEGKVGVYGGPGKKQEFGEETAEAAFNASLDKRYHSTVLVRRLGEAVAPVDVDVYFENGETVREHWDGQYRWMRYAYDKNSKVKMAEVDAEHKLVLDANYTNNSRVVREDNRAAAKWYVRWIFWLENLFFAASYFS
jgi:aminopeptidase N